MLGVHVPADFLANTNRSLRDLRRELVELAERIQDQD